MGCARFRPKKWPFAPIREVSYEEVHSQCEPALFKKRLAEPHSDAERDVLLKLLADEEAKEPPPKNSILNAALICIKEPPLRKGLLLLAASVAGFFHLRGG